MDLNKLRDQLKSSRPVQVTREGRLRIPDEPREGEPRREPAEPSRLKHHTFAAAPWHVADPKRYRAELDLMTRHTQARATVGGDELVFEEWIETDFGLPFHFRITVPARFPHEPPRVVCLSPEVPRELRFHVYSDGRLCLFTAGEWRSDRTVLDVRNWACEWAFNVVPKQLAAAEWMSPEHRS